MGGKPEAVAAGKTPLLAEVEGATSKLDIEKTSTVTTNLRMVGMVRSLGRYFIVPL